MAMAAMIRMIATTIKSSISEKPFCLRISKNLPLRSTDSQRVELVRLVVFVIGHECRRTLIRVSVRARPAGSFWFVVLKCVYRSFSVVSRGLLDDCWSWADVLESPTIIQPFHF